MSDTTATPIIRWGLAFPPPISDIAASDLCISRRAAMTQAYEAARTLQTTWPRLRKAGWAVRAYVLSHHGHYRTVAEARAAIAKATE